MFTGFMGEQPSLYLTQDDLERLSQLLDKQGGRFARLERELARAVIVSREEIPHDVVTALLGLRVGQSIDWELPSGDTHRYRIMDVPYQPEGARS